MSFLLNIIILCLLLLLFFPKIRYMITIIIFILLFIALIQQSYEGYNNQRRKKGIYIKGRPRFIVNKIVTPTPPPTTTPIPGFDASFFISRP